MTEQVTPEQIQRPARTLEARDLFFAAINGLFIGILAPFIFHNISAVLPVSRTIFAIALTILCVLGITVGYGLSRFSPKLGFFFSTRKVWAHRCHKLRCRSRHLQSLHLGDQHRRGELDYPLQYHLRFRRYHQ
jgi:hypothetical protein